MTVYPVDELTSPVDVFALADYLDLEDDDPVLPGVLLSATDMLITHMQRDILPRQWNLIVREPTEAPRQIINTRDSRPWIEIPYGATAIESATDHDGDALDYRADLDSIPARLSVNTRALHKVEFTSGFDPVPEPIKEAVKALAAFLYEHRGHCDAADAIARSGAAGMVRRYRVERL